MSQWKQEFCGCCSDAKGAFLSLCCPCYVVGKVSEAVGDSCFACGCLSLFFHVCVLCAQRGKVRQAHNIEGGACGDCMASWCCPCCTLAQMRSEVGGSGMAKDDVVTQQPSSIAAITM